MVQVVSNIKAENFSLLETRGRVAFCEELLRITDPLTPRKTGALIRSGRVANNGKEIRYETPYARRLWYGDHFRFNGAPIRGSRWVERAYAGNKEHLLGVIDKFLRRGL